MPREYEQLYDIINVSKFNKYMSDRIGRTLLLNVSQARRSARTIIGKLSAQSGENSIGTTFFFVHAKCLLADLKELAKNRQNFSRYWNEILPNDARMRRRRNNLCTHHSEQCGAA